MAAQLIEPADLIEVSRPPVLIYGQPGSGKTSLAQTADNPLTLDFDTGVHRSAFRKTAMRFGNWEDVLGAQKSNVFDRFETIIIDTVGTCLEFLSHAVIAGNAKLGTRAGGLSLQGFGVLKGTFGTWLAGLRQAGKQVVMIAHQKEDKDGDSRMLRPDIMGGSYSIVMNLADIVGYMSYRNNQRFVSWDPTDSYFAKNGAGLASAVIPDFASQPHFLAELLTKAKGNLGKTSEASADAAQKVGEWEAWLASDPTIEQIHESLPKLAELTGGLKAQVWTLITARMTGAGYVWDWNGATKIGTKRFIPKPEAA